MVATFNDLDSAAADMLGDEVGEPTIERRTGAADQRVNGHGDLRQVVGMPILAPTG